MSPADCQTTASTAGRAHTLRYWGLYLAKAAALMGVLFVIGRFSPSLPPAGVALLWVAVSGASALGLAYQVVVRKTLKQAQYREGGWRARLNNGRVFSLVVSFVLSAACVASLIFEVAKWGLPQWCLIIASVPVFLLVSVLVRRLLHEEYEPAFLTSHVAQLSGIVVWVLLCGAFLVMTIVQPSETYTSASEAFQSAPQPFADAPSALMREAGDLTALTDGLTSYAMAQTAQVSYVWYLVWRVIMGATTLFAVASLLSLSLLSWPDLKRVFLPLEAAKDPDASRRPVARYVVVAVALPILLFAAFLVADHVVAQAAQTEEYSAAESFVRGQAGLAADLIDGTYYEHEAVAELTQQMGERSSELSAEAKEALVPTINAVYDAQLNNVDAYLDWYYSLPGDYERLATMVTGTVEDYVSDQFASIIGEGVDDTELVNQIEYFSAQACELEADFRDELASYRLDDVPEWLLDVQDTTDSASLLKTLEPTQKLVDAGTRIGVSVGAGATVGIVSKQLVKKAVDKPFFKQLVKKITEKIASKGVGTAIGGALGTVVGGPVGTAVGVAASAAIGVGADYGLLKLDEYLNRDQFRQEIVDIIEEQRAETLAIVQ